MKVSYDPIPIRFTSVYPKRAPDRQDLSGCFQLEARRASINSVILESVPNDEMELTHDYLDKVDPP